METNNLELMGAIEKISMEKVWEAYNINTYGKEDIFELGFNTNSGYVYIALENGISIASCFGQSVDFIVTDSENGGEYFYDAYSDAERKLEKINERV